MSNLPESPLVQSHLSAPTSLEDGYDSDACQNHNAAIEMEGPQELDEPELGKSWINRKISMIFPLVSCCSCVNNPSSS